MISKINLNGRVNFLIFHKISLERILDLFLLAMFAAPALSVLAVAYVHFILANRGKCSFLYKGERLGREKKPFDIYKIQTLKPGVEKKLKNSVLPFESKMELPMGKFYRHTRIDEIPQLFNVLKGEMSFFGPRPVRRVIYNLNKKTIRGYHKRFRVKPGLIGPAQIILPHSAPKKMRSIINNRYISSPNRIYRNLQLLVIALPLIIINFLSQLGCNLRTYTKLFATTGSLKEKRQSKRFVNHKNTISVSVADSVDLDFTRLKVIDINKQTIAIETSLEMPENEFNLKMAVRAGNRLKMISCTGQTIQKYLPVSKNNKKMKYIVAFKAASPFNQYMIDQYVLKHSIMASIIK